MYGNIEAHVRSSQWYSHRHHRNPRYNNVILHVTYNQDTNKPTVLHNGQIIPTITLEALLAKQLVNSIPGVKAPVQGTFKCPHLGRYRENKQLSNILAIAGIERFHVKANSFLQALLLQEPGQVLFTGICRSLGYSQNSQAFATLANKLPLSFLKHFEGQTMQQALLLGSAGLLPSQRFRQTPVLAHHRGIKELEQNWKASGLRDSMNKTEWCFFRVRPVNFPTRRIAAMSYLLHRYRQSGLTTGILSLFSRAPGAINYGQLIHSLALPAHGYWANHCDFTIPIGKTPALIGDDKAAEILVNTVLPFAHALSHTVCDLERKLNLEALYRSLPGSTDNELIRYMKKQLCIPDKRLSACHQQGLLQIFKSHCRYRDCAHCPVSLN